MASKSPAATANVPLVTQDAIAAALGSKYKLRWNGRAIADGAVASLPSIALEADALVQATSAARPTRAVRAKGPALVFGGTHALTCTLSSPIPAGTRPHVFLVAALTDVSAAGAMIKLSVGESGHHVLAYIGTGGVGSVVKWNIERADSSGAALACLGGRADTRARIYETGFTAGADDALVVDGAGRDSMNPGVASRDGTPGSPIDFVRLASGDTGPSFTTKIDIYDVIVTYDIDEDTKDAVRAALRAEWALGDTIQSRTQYARLDRFDAAVAASAAGNFTGAVEYDGHILLAPSSSVQSVPHSKMAQCTVALGFKKQAAWKFRSRTSIDPLFKHFDSHTRFGDYSYGCTDGTRIYRMHLPSIVGAGFETAPDSAFKYKDISAIAGFPGTGRGYIFPFTDGVHIYFPQLDFGTATGVRMLRLNPALDFESDAAWAWSPDTTTLTALAKGYMGGDSIPASTEYPLGATVWSAHQYGTTMHGNHLLHNPSVGLFDDPDAWSVCNVEERGADYRGYSSMTRLGPCVYTGPGETTVNAGDGYFAARWNWHTAFTPANWEFFDLRHIEPTLRGTTGMWNDGQRAVWAVNEGPGGGAMIIFDPTRGNFDGDTDGNAGWEYVHSTYYGNGVSTVRGMYGGSSFNGYHAAAPYHGHGAILVRAEP